MGRHVYLWCADWEAGVDTMRVEMTFLWMSDPLLFIMLKFFIIDTDAYFMLQVNGIIIVYNTRRLIVYSIFSLIKNEGWGIENGRDKQVGTEL